MRSPFLIEALPGYSPQVGRLVCMLDYARATTHATVEGLSMRQLDHLPSGFSNTIGMLLEHIACTEQFYQAQTMGITFTPDELRRREIGSELGEAGRVIAGHTLDHYLDHLAAVREQTLAELKRRDDEWLAAVGAEWNGMAVNHHFMWFHVAEDEINHRGQMRLLRKHVC